MDGLVLFGLGNDDIPVRCQILSVWSSFTGTLFDLLIALFVVTVRTSGVHMPRKCKCIWSLSYEKAIVWHGLLYGRRVTEEEDI